MAGGRPENTRVKYNGGGAYLSRGEFCLVGPAFGWSFGSWDPPVGWSALAFLLRHEVLLVTLHAKVRSPVPSYATSTDVSPFLSNHIGGKELVLANGVVGA